MTCNCTGACRRPPYTCGGSLGPPPAGWVTFIDGSSVDWVRDHWEPENLAAKPASDFGLGFLAGLIAGCALGGDFVWIIGQLFNG